MSKLFSFKNNEGNNNILSLFFVVLVAILFRWAISIGSYSGKGKKHEMFGDYEAHRHWMEITYQLPMSKWYVNSSDNDLEYWGLDYPPLTAYHSWIMGFISNIMNSSWVSLHESRGLETYEHKVFMRSTVLITDMLTLIPAICFYVLFIQKPRSSFLVQGNYLATYLLYPGLLLIDYGHFQYNCASLGLFLWGTIGIMSNYQLFAAVAFVCALNHKQMELYHSLPFFFYMLASCFKETSRLVGFLKLTKIAIIVAGTFFLIWFPFIFDLQLFTIVLRRIFPINRGLFEDKVANFWCVSSVFVKWKQTVPIAVLVKLSTLAVIVANLPSSVVLLWNPTKNNFKKALLISSLSFFLFSFHVHEKSILICAIPALLLINDQPLACSWLLLQSTISLFPLCVKDNICVAFFALTAFYYVWLNDVMKLSDTFSRHFWTPSLMMLTYHASILVGLFICFSSLLVSAPERYPDLFSLLNSAYCCAHFVAFLIYFNYLMILDNRKLLKVEDKEEKKKL